MLRAWKNVPATLVMFETAPVWKKLPHILQVLGNRKMTVLRELTKIRRHLAAKRCGNSGQT